MIMCITVVLPLTVAPHSEPFTNCTVVKRRSSVQTCITFALSANLVTQRTEQTQSILWKDIARGLQITVVLKEEQIKKKGMIKR
jgi:hypothetical protein